MARLGEKHNSSYEVNHLRYLIYKDILNGYNYTKVVEKLQRNGYNTSIDTSEYKKSTYKQYYWEALKMLKVDQSEIDELKTLFYQRYENLYNEAMEANDRLTALNTLNAMNKMMGLTTEQIDVKTTSVVDIKFGFGDKEE